MKKFSYQFVFLIADSKTKKIINLIGCKDLDVLTSLISTAALDNDVVYRAFTKAKADKLKLKPSIACLGPAEKGVKNDRKNKSS